MGADQSLPQLWLLSDARNECVLETALRAFSTRIAFVFRHYHLPPQERFARFRQLRRICRECGHLIVLAGGAARAKQWRADGCYGAPRALAPRRTGLLMIATAHDLREIGQANRMKADAVMLSPVFPTRSHPGANTLGSLRFRILAARAQMPVIALGGMDRARAQAMKWPRWAAVDGLYTGNPRPDS